MSLHTMSLGKWMPATFLLSSTLWAAVLISVPYVVRRDDSSPQLLRGASVVYLLGSLICHQRAERSFHPWGVPVPVCARCEGIYLAAPFSIAIVFARRRRDDALASRTRCRRLIVFASVPTMMTLAWEWSGGGMTPGIVRALAGAALGAAIAGAIAAVAIGELR